MIGATIVFLANEYLANDVKQDWYSNLFANIS